MHLAVLVDATARLRATRSRLEKRAILVEVLRDAGDDLALVARYLAGELAQRRTGFGWAGLRDLPVPAQSSSLSIADVDRVMAEAEALSGTGSTLRRRELLTGLLGRATPEEQLFVRDLILGELRQGASDTAVLDAVAEAFTVPPHLVRRAAMLGGGTPEVAVAAATGGVAALESFRLVVGRAVRPMLAASAPDVAAAVAGFADSAVVWDAKLDGIRAQVHRLGGEVRIFTRSLDDITTRLPEVVARALALPADDFVLDGEVLLIDEAGRPRPFQETSARTASLQDRTQVRFFAFDLLALAGEILLDEPLRHRREALASLVPASDVVAHLETQEAAAVETFFDQVVAAGLEGVVGKELGAPYAAGRRGASWVKVKPRHTLDLVVIAVEWGSGRRRGLLSNIHLAARGDEGELVPVGKTFKGMTDAMLAWQTERFLDLEVSRDGHVVHVRPEQVVEIAVDGVQRSRRYPGGVALRFARVVGYRDDKTAEEADGIETVRGLGDG